MTEISIAEIGTRLIRAGKLDCRPICVYSSEKIPEKGLSLVSINRCIAKALFALAVDKEIPSLFIGEDTLEGCCPGGQGWFGFSKFAPFIKYFVSTGSKEVRGGAADILKVDPKNVEQTIKAVGTIRPLGKYIVMQACTELREENPGVKSVLCFGTSEQIRNLCALIYFSRINPFSSILTPWGPACATFVTYPAGMASNTPANCAFTGPMDPTINPWFPPNFLALGIPVNIARQMSADLEESFITKRPNVAYPKHREKYTS
jgi:hypothetical protein